MRCNLTDTTWQIIDKKILMIKEVGLIYFFFILHLEDLKLNKLNVNCSAYGDKTKYLENLKQGDFVKIF